MKRIARITTAVSAALSLLQFSGRAGDPSAKALNSITVESARMHLSVLAADSMKGRKTPSPELTKAGEYIATQFRNFGLQPVNGSYYHTFTLNKLALGPRERNRIVYQAEKGKPTVFALQTDFIPYSESGSASVTAGVVFAGYGIVDSTRNYDDFAALDVKGKFVAVVQGELAPVVDPSISGGVIPRRSVSGRLDVKIKRALERGAAGLLVINALHRGRFLTPRGYPWPEFNKLFRGEPTMMQGPYDNKIPVVNIGESIVTVLFGSVNRLEKIMKQIDSTRQPASFDCGRTLEVETAINNRPIEIRNVVGWLRGTDPILRDEIVTIGAHYDHVGSKTVADTVDGIFNGADDNASGTTAVIEIARAYSLLESLPRRSVLFIAFAGEESGLLGSRAYVQAPSFPIARHVAMFNLDMVGRNSPDSLSVGGDTRSPELARINEEENKKIGFTLAYDIEQYFFRSDQASFAQEKIPSIFYFTGEHADYHRVTDEVEKINFEKLTRVAKLCFLTSHRVANLDHRVQYTEPTAATK